MADFVSGKTKVLIATTVIEVGVNVPNATLMIIEGADRFGLAQMHQLRGRVGRGSSQSYCVLLTGSNQPQTLERLQIMRSCSDGFLLAEKDMELRGAGQLLAFGSMGCPTSILRISFVIRIPLWKHGNMPNGLWPIPKGPVSLRKASLPPSLMDGLNRFLIPD